MHALPQKKPILLAILLNAEFPSNFSIEASFVVVLDIIEGHSTNDFIFTILYGA